MNDIHTFNSFFQILNTKIKVKKDHIHDFPTKWFI